MRRLDIKYRDFLSEETVIFLKKVFTLKPSSRVTVTQMMLDKWVTTPKPMVLTPRNTTTSRKPKYHKR